MADDEMRGAERNKPGRAPFEPTAEQRALVRALTARNADRTHIAAAVGVSLPTLRKCFAAELAPPETPSLFAPQDAPAAPPPQTTVAAPPRRTQAGGRRRWVPTQHERDRVMTMLAGGAKLAAVATILKVSEPTLRRACAKEIEQAADVRHAEMVETLYRTGRAGNVTAQRAFIELATRAKAAHQPGAAPQPAAADNARAPRPGKKEQRLEAAASVKGKFAAPPPPPSSRTYN